MRDILFDNVKVVNPGTKPFGPTYYCKGVSPPLIKPATFTSPTPSLAARRGWASCMSLGVLPTPLPRSTGPLRRRHRQHHARAAMLPRPHDERTRSQPVACAGSHPDAELQIASLRAIQYLLCESQSI